MTKLTLALVVAGLSTALCACGSSVYEGKNDDGIKFVIKKDDVVCKEEFTPAVDRGGTHWRDSYRVTTAYNTTRCKANGFTEDLSGKTRQWTGSYTICKRDEYNTKIIATKSTWGGIAGQQRTGRGDVLGMRKGGVTRAITGRQPNDFNCVSALYFNKYVPD